MAITTISSTTWSSCLLAAGRSWLARPDWLKQLDAAARGRPGLVPVAAHGRRRAVRRSVRRHPGRAARAPALFQRARADLPAPDAAVRGARRATATAATRSAATAASTRRWARSSELATLAREFQAHGISLVVDFVFNHTSDEHEWARRAQAGDAEYQDYYFIFPDRDHARRVRAHPARDLPRRCGAAASPGARICAAGSGRPSTASSGT